MGRFLNADALVSTGQGLLGNNMFAYCLNSPIAYTDAYGTAAQVCISADGRVNDSPWKDPAGGGSRNNITSTNSCGNVYDKFYVAKLLKYFMNSDEQAVLDAEYVAFYKGYLIVKLPIGNNAFSYGIIFMGDEGLTVDDVRHEYGHSRHMSMIGIKAYTLTVAIPSLYSFWSQNFKGSYYSLPWEYIPEVLGDVNRNGGTYSYDPFAQENAQMYFWYTILISLVI